MKWRSRCEYALDGTHHAIELGAFGGELPAAGSGQRVEARSPVVLRRAPLRLHPTIEEQALKRRIQRTLANRQHIVRGQAQVLDDGVSVLGAADERFQDQ